MMIRVALHDGRTGKSEIGDERLLASLADDPGVFVWADLDAVDETRERALLRDVFHIDPLVIEDTQHQRHPPKLEWFDDYLFLLLKGFDAQTRNVSDYSVVQVAFFVGYRFLITRRSERILSIGATWDVMAADRLALDRGPAYVCYCIVKHMIGRYTPIVLDMEQWLEELEAGMLEHPGDDLLEALVNYKGQLKRLRRIFTYQQGLMAELAHNPAGLITDEVRHEFNDAHEHMERLSSLSQLYQELAGDLMDGYLSLSAHRLNQIMKVLTIATVIFLPLTFLAGIYGMNFEYMPELAARAGYFIVLGVMVGLVAVLLLLFRRLKWL